MTSETITTAPERELVERIVRDVAELDGCYGSDEADVMHVSAGDLTIIVERAIQSLLADKAKLEEALREVKHLAETDHWGSGVHCSGIIEMCDAALNRSTDHAG